MGFVNFDTNVTKTVDLNKTVNLDVNKFVTSNASVSGNLATAEASADAVGTGTGTGGIQTLNFLLDGGGDLQTTIVNTDFPTNTGTAPGTNFPPPIFFPPLPDGETFDDTDIGGSALRTFQLSLLDPNSPGQAALAANVAGSGRISFSNDDETASNQSVNYSNAGTPFQAALPNADLSNPANAFIVDDVIFNPGEGTINPDESGTLRVEVRFTDAQGDFATGAVVFTDNPADGGPFLDGQDLIFPLGLFTGDIPPLAAGTVIAPGVLAIPGTADADLDFDQLVSVDLLVLDDPGTGSIVSTNLFDFENPANGGTDISVDDFRFVSQQQNFEEGLLAETDTFAQVQPGGAFSFSESLAASNSLFDDAA